MRRQIIPDRAENGSGSAPRAGNLISAVLNWSLRHGVVLTVLLFLAAGWHIRQDLFAIGRAPSEFDTQAPEAAVADAPVIPASEPSGPTRIDDSTDSESDGKPASSSGAVATTALEAAAGTPGQENMEVTTLLADARQAYWSCDFTLAEAKYRQALAVGDPSPAIYGELGDLYLHQGRRADAASAYAAAAHGFIAAGRPEQARGILGFIGELDPNAATQLRLTLGNSQ